MASSVPLQDGGWHLKREIQLGHLLTTIGMIAAVAMYVSKIDQRLALLEQSVKHQQEVDSKQDEDFIRVQRNLDKRLDRIDNKLDALIEKAGRK